MKPYSETEKVTARRVALKQAIWELTTNRNETTITNATHVAEVKKYFLNRDQDSREYIESILSDSTVGKWENFYKSIVQTRKASELKVAYLSGPNPENDLSVMVGNGILPENVWAFESNNKMYNEAVKSTLNSRFPFIKLHKGNIANFIMNSPVKFDIIYLDFCGPIPNTGKGQKNLSVITEILSHHALNSPGILLTNIALPPKGKNEEYWREQSKLVASYLYPKPFLERNNLEKDQHNNFSEGAIVHSFTPNEWLEEVSGDLENYYSQFITRVVMDISTIIIPHIKFSLNDSYMKRFFTNGINDKNLKKFTESLYHFKDNDSNGDVITEMGDYDILWTLAAVTDQKNQGDINYPNWVYHSDDFRKLAQSFFNQIGSPLNDGNFKRFERLQYLLLGSEKTKFYREEFKVLAEKKWWKELPVFCDLFTTDTLIHLLIGQLSVPYHINVSTTKRWSYKAKETRMFMDMFVLDECRYIYDWMPTVDMIENGLQDYNRQISFRFALDALSKNRRWYATQPFFGAAVIDQFEKGFEAKTLTPRMKIN